MSKSENITYQEPGRVIKSGIIVIFLLTIGGIVAASFIKYPDTITIPIQMEIKDSRTSFYVNEALLIDRWIVKNGDTVSENSTLAILKNNSRYEDVLILKTIVDSLKNYPTFFSKIVPNHLVLGKLQRAYSLLKLNIINHNNNENFYYSKQTIALMDSLLEDWENDYLLKTYIKGIIAFETVQLGEENIKICTINALGNKVPIGYFSVSAAYITYFKTGINLKFSRNYQGFEDVEGSITAIAFQTSSNTYLISVKFDSNIPFSNIKSDFNVTVPTSNRTIAGKIFGNFIQLFYN